MMEILPRLDLSFKVSQGSRKSFLTKAPLALHDSTNKGCITPSPKGEIAVALILRDILVPSVVRSIMVYVLRAHRCESVWKEWESIEGLSNSYGQRERI